MLTNKDEEFLKTFYKHIEEEMKKDYIFLDFIDGEFVKVSEEDKKFTRFDILDLDE